MTDFVVAYVDGEDPEWQDGYNEASFKHNRVPDCNSARFRSWGTLKYLMRGVAKCMPWIRTVHLVVERPSQVPEWISDEVHVVYHKDIIPARYLPTYNSTCIEMFLYRIPGLAERFIYANDDMFPVNPLKESDFYKADKPRLKVISKLFSPTKGMYAHQLHAGEAMVRDMLGLPENNTTQTRTGHNLNPMLKSTWEKLWEAKSKDIQASLSAFRQKKNVNQELCSYWHILSGNYEESRRTHQYIEMAQEDAVIDLIEHTPVQLICINDKGALCYKLMKKRMARAFEKRFPDKCKYER